MKRTDIHRPSAFNPTDYTFVCARYDGTDDLQEWLHSGSHEVLKQASSQYGWAPQESPGTCYLCGASASYHGVFLHKPSNKLVQFGHICAEKLDLLQNNGCEVALAQLKRDVKNAREYKAGKQKAAVLLSDFEIKSTLQDLDKVAHDFYQALPFRQPCDAVEKLFSVDTTDKNKHQVGQIINTYHRNLTALRDLHRKLVSYGDWSEKQVDYARRLDDYICNFDFANEYNKIASKPEAAIEEGRYEVTGLVVSNKVVETVYGHQNKLLVETATKNKLYGTCPNKIVDAKPGDKVVFTATVTAKEVGFGFYSRPSKARLVA